MEIGAQRLGLQIGPSAVFAATAIFAPCRAARSAMARQLAGLWEGIVIFFVIVVFRRGIDVFKIFCRGIMDRRFGAGR